MLHLAWVRTICLEYQLDVGVVFVVRFAYVSSHFSQARDEIDSLLLRVYR